MCASAHFRIRTPSPAPSGPPPPIRRTCDAAISPQRMNRPIWQKSASRSESALFLPISIVILKISFQIKSNKIYLYAEIKILNNTKMPLFSKTFILKIIPKSDPWFFWKWKIHAIISVSKLHFFSFSIILADYTRMSSFCKRHILRFMLCLSVAIP